LKRYPGGQPARESKPGGKTKNLEGKIEAVLYPNYWYPQGMVKPLNFLEVSNSPLDKVASHPQNRSGEMTLELPGSECQLVEELVLLSFVSHPRLC
jgi:hypothetical protein